MDQYKILIIDDQVENLQAMVSIFEEHRPQYIIYQTNNPLDAVYICQQTNPNLVITDWEMPGLNGIELIKHLRLDKKTAQIPVIMATGINISSTDLKDALEAGAIDFIRKPFDPLELIARVHAALLLFESHRKVLEAKDIELAESKLYLLNSQNCASDVKKKTEQLINLVGPANSEIRELVQGIIEQIEEHTHNDSWQRFNIAFNRIYSKFHQNLLSDFPDLTTAELKLCTLLKLGLDNKSIASILHQSNDSIKVSRSRLRKKLGLDTSQNLESFFIQF
jgi:DNA-binding response OmpR family regulator